MASQQFKKMMAKKMISHKRPESHFIYQSKKHPAPTKEGSHDWFEAKRDKKKLPPVPGRNRKKDEKYANMSMNRFLKKYPEWQV